MATFPSLARFRLPIPHADTDADFIRQLAENIREVLWVSDPEKRTMFYVSAAYESLWGRSRESLYKNPSSFLDSIHPDDRDRVRAELPKQKDGTFDVQYRLLRPDGTLRWIRARAFPIRDDSGEILRIGGISEDITSQIEVEDSLKRRLGMESLLASISTLLLQLRPDKGAETIQESLQRIGEFEGVDRSYLFLFSGPEPVVSEIHEWTRTNSIPSVQRFLGADIRAFPWVTNRFERNEPVYVGRPGDLPGDAAAEQEALVRDNVKSLLVVPIFSDGVLRGALGFDALTEEKQWIEEDISLLRVAGEIFISALARLETEKRLAFLARITSMSTEAIFATNEENRIVFWSQGAERLFGFREEEVLGRKVGDFLIPQDRIDEKEWLVDRTMHGILSEIRTERLHQSGRRIPVLVTAFPIQEKAGKDYVQATILHDLTEMAGMEDKLLDHSRMVAIGEMAAGIAHEIRNPLFGISTVAQIFAREPSMNIEFRELADSMRSEIERLNKLLENLLLYARPRRLDIAPQNANEQILSLIDFCGAQLNAKRLNVAKILEEDLPPISYDAAQMRQVLLNLFLNAIEASPTGDTISVRSSATSDGSPQWKFQIANRGTPIDAEFIEKIFEPFFSTKRGGSGLGLSVCRKIVEEHGGAIRCRSDAEEGTVFEITLPLKGGRAATSP